MKYTCSEISNNCIAFNYRYTCVYRISVCDNGQQYN